jgi:PAS domain S-box-containing protein
LFKSLLSKFKSSDSISKVHDIDTWYSTAITDCADGTWDINLETGEIYLSPKLIELIGYSQEETSHRPLQWWLDHIHPDDQPEIIRKVDDFSNVKSEFTYFEGSRFLCKNGDYVWLEHHAKLLIDKNKRVQRITAIVFNITPQKYINNQLYAIISEQEKEARNKMKFLSSLSHEFRSPLSGIIGMTTLLKETVMSEDQRHFTENIANSTEMLLALVNDILDVSKLNSGKFEFEKIRFSPALILKRAADLIRPSIMKKNLTFRLKIAENIPDLTLGDPTRLQQILVNLLSNAAKFTSSGGITLSVEKIIPKSTSSASVDTKAMAIYLHFEISDTGIGIAPEIQEHLFEDYTQADRATTRIYGGTGLGLSICKELVHLMGGKIGVRSAPGNGSTFWFTIPFDDINEALSHNLSHQSQHESVTIKSKLNILLVEDNQVNQEVMRGLLNLLGDEVTVANNGEEAINQVESTPFDIILMDLNMPILDGLSATKSIRQLPNGHIPIIAVTANTFTGELENCMQHGISHVLTKPIDKATLELALQPYRHNTKSPIQEKPANNQPQEVIQSPSGQTIDHKTIRTLINDLGKEKVKSLVDMYRKDATMLLIQIKSCSPSDTKHYAHTLAGMSENLGILMVGKTARDIMSASQETPENIPALVQNLESQFESSLTEVHNVLSAHEPIL